MVRNPNQNNSKKLTPWSYSFINCKFINWGKIHLRFPNFNLSIGNYNWTSTQVKKLLATRLRKRNSRSQQCLNKRKQFTKSFDSRSWSWLKTAFQLETFRILNSCSGTPIFLKLFFVCKFFLVYCKITDYSHFQPKHCYWIRSRPDDVAIDRNYKLAPAIYCQWSELVTLSYRWDFTTPGNGI